MTFTPGGPSYGPPAQPTAGGRPKNLGIFLLAGVAVLGVLNFLLGFAPYVTLLRESLNSFQASPHGLGLLLLGGLLAAVSLLPKQSYTGAAAAASVSGFLLTLFIFLNLDTDSGWGAILIVIFGFLQAVVALAAVLFEAGILKQPASRPAAPAYGGPGPAPQGYGGGPQQAYGPPQGYGPQGGYGQGVPQGSQQGYSQQQGYPQQGGYPQQSGYPQPGYGQPAQSQSAYGQQGYAPGFASSEVPTTSYQQPQYSGYSQPQGSPYQQPTETSSQHPTAPSGTSYGSTQQHSAPAYGSQPESAPEEQSAERGEQSDSAEKSPSAGDSAPTQVFDTRSEKDDK